MARIPKSPQSGWATQPSCSRWTPILMSYRTCKRKPRSASKRFCFIRLEVRRWLKCNGNVITASISLPPSHTNEILRPQLPVQTKRHLAEEIDAAHFLFLVVHSTSTVRQIPELQGELFKFWKSWIGRTKIVQDHHPRTYNHKQTFRLLLQRRFRNLSQHHSSMIMVLRSTGTDTELIRL